MDEKGIDREFEGTLNRRQFLRRSAGGAVALSSVGLLIAACGGGDDGGQAGGEATTAAEAGTTTAAEATTAAAGGERAKVTWISPRGTLDVMDDYNLWVPITQGYFDALNLDVELVAGPQDATATTKFVAENQADMGYPSPGVLTSSIDSGVPVISIWEQYPAQVFDFSLPEDSPIATVQDLEGKKISVGSAGWSVIIDPLLVEAGVDPKSVSYVESGAQWSQVVSQGQADAGLAWEGLRAQLLGQGLKLKFLLGSDFSQGPSNVYSVRAADLEDPAMQDVWTRFLQGVVMGFEFGKANPQAAAQITYDQLPALKDTLSPQIALESMLQLATGYGASARAGNGWGYHDPAAWDAYLKAVFDLGQTKKQLTADQVYTNDYVEPANSGADVAKAQADAEAFELNADFAETTVPEGTEL